MKKQFKIGDQVSAILRLASKKKVSVTGKIKAIREEFGHTTYTVEQGLVEDFTTRKVK